MWNKQIYYSLGWGACAVLRTMRTESPKRTSATHLGSPSGPSHSARIPSGPSHSARITSPQTAVLSDGSHRAISYSTEPAIRIAESTDS